MLWESGSNNKDDANERGWGSNNNPLHPQVTPVLVPSQSGTRTVQQPVPIVVPDVEELKEQFQQQQNMLTQIKETIKENESQLSSKGKKVEAYANRLSQIRARNKNTDGKSSNIPAKTITPSTAVRPLTRRSSKENVAKESDASEKDKTAQSPDKLSPKGKVSELKKRLQESKLKFEERAGKEVSETKKIESMVENLRMQLEERDVTIQELQKMVDQPTTPSVKSDGTLRKSKGRLDGKVISSKSTQTMRPQQTDESIEIITLQNRIYELEAKILDLEESLKEKESVIDARTQAVTLLSQDLSIKGKNTLECLEETRQEMRSMQSNFIIIENQLKKELVEKDDELTSTEEKLKKLESINFELSSKNRELEEKLVNSERRCAEVELVRKSMNESIVRVENDDKVAELTNKINVLNKELDDSNKSMIKMKLEHKNKIRSLNKTIEMLKEASDDKAEIHRLQTMVDEFEVIRESLQNKIAELEEEKVTEKKLKDTINELEASIRQHSAIAESHLQTISNLEKEKFDLSQSNQDQNILIENLYAKIQSLESESAEKESRIADLGRRLIELEEESRARLEAVKCEHGKEIEMLESYYGAKLAGGGDRREFEEYRISNELNNVQVEEQIELLIREKQQLLEKLKSLSGVSSTESIAFETVDHSEFQGANEQKPSETDSVVSVSVATLESSNSMNRELHLQRITDEQQTLINDLQNAIAKEKEKALEYQKKIENLEESMRKLEQVSSELKPEKMDEGEAAKTPKSSANVKNKIKKIQMELLESRKTIQEQSEKLEDLNMKLEEKELLIKNYIEKIELFEKDDWGRENDWMATQDDFEHVQELQKKCLSLENSLIELTEDCERLRKENIEVVHLLSEEKVKRKKLLERLNIEEHCDPATVELFQSRLTTGTMDESVEVLSRSIGENQTEDWSINDLDERVSRLVESAEALEDKLRTLDSGELHSSEGSRNLEALVRELQEKLEWSNIVLASKDTEIFRLQSLLEDSSKTIEDLQRDVREVREKVAEKDARLNEMLEELRRKEVQVEEISVNFARLQESVHLENARTSSNESQLKELMATVKDMESDAAKKEAELKEIEGILAEKNLDIHNLRQWLEQANSDLTYSYKEHLENMDKCLRDKEQEYDALLAERNALDEAKRNLMVVNEDMSNQRVELSSKIESLTKELEARDAAMEELKAKLSAVSVEEGGKTSEVEELKLKIKKLAANLKKKVQNEKDLLQQVKDYEEFHGEKEKIVQKLQEDLTEAKEKWATEMSEKEQFKAELAVILSAKSTAEAENADLKERLKSLENEYMSRSQKAEYKFQQMETQLQKMYENSEQMRLKQEQDKAVIASLESELSNLSRLSAEASEGRKENEELRRVLAETCGKYEESKFRYEELNLEKAKADAELSGLREELERLRTANSCQQAKLQEQMAVIESLENDLTQTREQLRGSEEKLCFLEERRSSLENKTEDMLKRIEEDSKNVEVIDDLTNQIRSFAESEESLKAALKNLSDKNKELELEAREMSAEKARLEKELSESRQKLNNLNMELQRLRELDAEKTETLEFLTSESEKVKALKMESKHKSERIQKLEQDIQLLEADLKENVENSKAVERTLNHKVEDLRLENASLTERVNSLTEATRDRPEESKPVKRKKSVTFRTDETDYIRDLKTKLHEYEETMKKSNEEMENLKMELFRERLRHEVTEVVTEAKEKAESLRSTPEKVPRPEGEGERTFDAVAFFGAGAPTEGAPFLEGQTDGSSGQRQDNPDQVTIDYDSLMWDDGWGTDGHLEEQYLSTQAAQPNQEKCEQLEKEVKTLQGEKERLEEELQALQGKYAKAIKKMKEQKAAYEKLQSEVTRLKSDAEFGGLDGAIMDELKAQIRGFEQREKELAKSLEAAKLEKEALLKRIDVLNAGNEKFVEMKERQDNEMELWETKNRELMREITELRNQMRSQEGGATTAAAVAAPAEEDTTVGELKNRIEALEWENCELKEVLEEKMELLEMRNAAGEGTVKDETAAKEVEDLRGLKEALERRLSEEERKNAEVVGELQQQVTALAAENETLQEILGEMKQSARGKTPPAPAPAVPEPSPVPAMVVGSPETKIFDYFKAAPANDVFSAFAQPVQSEPVVEPIVERKVASQAHASNDRLERELEQLRQENGLLQQQLAEAQSVIASIKREAHEMAEKYRTEYESAVSFHLEEKNSALQKVYELEQVLAVKIEELNGMSTRVRDLDQAVTMKAEEVSSLSRGRQELEQAFGMKAEESSSMRGRISELEQVLSAKLEDLKNASGRVGELQRALETKAEEVSAAERTVTELREQLRAKEDEVSHTVTGLEQALTAKTEEVNRLTLRARELEEECGRKAAALDSVQRMNEDLQRNAVEHSLPLESQIEALNQSLNTEKSTVEDLHRVIGEREETLRRQTEEIGQLRDLLSEASERAREATQEYEKQRALTEEYCDAKEKLEDLVSNLQTELQTANLELDLSRREVEDLRRAKEEAVADLESKMENVVVAETREVEALREELRRATENYERALAEAEQREGLRREEVTRLENAARAVEAHVESLKSELKEKESDIFELGQTLEEEQRQLAEMRALLEMKDAEIADLRQALSAFQEEISSFRNFEKQVKELRMAQIKQSGSDLAVTAEGDPDFTNWTEHELAELNTRLQSDLDTALYMLHQRDIRCDELTFELMQLLEERDTLQLRLSTAIRISEELRSLTSPEKASYVHEARPDSKDLTDQSNDRQGDGGVAKVPEEDLHELAQKISQLHSVGYIKDKTIQDETMQRHRDQMTLLGRVSDTEIGRDSQAPSPTSVTNWVRTGKSHQVMHI